MARSARRKEHAMTRKTMIAAVVAAAFFTGLAVSDGFARGGGGGGFAGHGSGGFGGAHPGGGFSGSGIKGGTATPGVNPGLLAIPIPQTPPPPVLNPGVTPSALGPSRITPSPGSSAGLSTTTNPGFANGTGSSIAPGRVHASRGRTNQDQSRAVQEMDRELDHKLSICRGC